MKSAETRCLIHPATARKIVFDVQTDLIQPHASWLKQAWPFDLHQGFYPPQAAQALFDRLAREAGWQRPMMSCFGRSHRLPRCVAYFADAGAVYRYSGLTHAPQDWPDYLLPVREKVEKQAGGAFNSLLCNRYRNGQDSMGWHSDDEPALGPAPLIAILSLGAPRRLLVRQKHPGAPAQALRLESGDLLVMHRGMQAGWQHALPKTKQATGERISLTWRQIKTP